ncbi:GNAT family N-acetyltransferase [Blastococcus sp. TML/M2B]|uniref:GNAT family N-acetyltransferase n=1 Tax=unclassified Blastococcus TaxID=2619396 RepID=UPI0019090D97|nr:MULTISPECIES: GNAT family N-acetyltransferase [unclassified Blastococcus]MBN1093787.1 GNAT family N-acetyltransferase [Blastococcus sp. TML/M2B]MBN1096090.1 GNAT family N-acetyltransferase [Blastococcus sp. TML/C7B]
MRSERLVLRPYRADDVGAVHRACQDADIQRWTTVPVPYTEADALAFVTETTVSGRAEGRGLLTAVEADGRFVGSAGLHFTRGMLGPGVGYWVAPWARGQGYAAEAARALADWAFRHDAVRVHLAADVRNTASQAVALRAGFVREGVIRAGLPYRDGTQGDAALFSRLPDD